ncbi:MAG: MFS transporter, partial [Rhodospirillales bacterium]
FVLESTCMKPRTVSDLYINIAHTIDHLVMLIYPVVVLAMSKELGLTFGEALTLSVGGWIAFGACSLPAGWLGDHWSRHGMLTVFFFGIGAATALTGLAQNAWQIVAGLTFIGVFAAIYHPIGIAMIVSNRDDVGRALGINGVAGNMGVAFAAIITGALADWIHWRAAFIVPGILIMLIGVGFAVFAPKIKSTGKKHAAPRVQLSRELLPRFFIVLLVATICGGLIFNSVTISMPKLFEERLMSITQTTFGIGALVSVVYVLASLAQILIGLLIDRYALKLVFIGIVALQAPALYLAGFADNYTMFAIAIGMMFVVFGQIPINDAMVAHYTHERWRSRVFAARYVVTFGASAAAVPVVGFLYDKTGGFELTFTIMSVLAIGTFLAALAMPTGKPQAQPA